MAETTAQVTIEGKFDDKDLAKGLREMAKAFEQAADEMSDAMELASTTTSKKWTGAFNNLRRNAKIATVAIGAIAVAGAAAGAFFLQDAIKGAADFEVQLTNIKTLISGTGGFNEAVDEMGDSLLDMSSRFGIAIGELTGAAYDVISAGFSDIADAEQVVAAGARAAVAGLSDAKTATAAVSAVLNGFKFAAEDAESVADSFFGIIKGGVTTLPQLAQAIPQVIPAAVAAGVSLEEMAASFTALTKGGLQTSVAATSLKAAFFALAAPTQGAVEAMQQLGIVTTDAHGSLLPLNQVIEQFRGLSLADIREAIPSQEAATAVLTLAENLEFLNEQIGIQQERGGLAAEAFALQEDTFSFALSQFDASVEELKTKIGETFLPIAKDVVDGIRPIVDEVILWVDENDELLKQEFAKFFEDADKSIKKLTESFPKLNKDMDDFDASDVGKGLGIISAIIDGIAENIRVVREGLLHWEIQWARSIKKVREIAERFEKDIGEKLGLNFLNNLRSIGQVLLNLSPHFRELSKLRAEFAAEGFRPITEQQRLLEQQAIQENLRLQQQLPFTTGTLPGGSTFVVERPTAAAVAQTTNETRNINLTFQIEGAVDGASVERTVRDVIIPILRNEAALGTV